MNDMQESKREWAAAGLTCLAYRHPRLQHWCGYVALPAGHPHHGKNYDDIDVDVHGGLTWADNHAPNQQPDGRWWIGFDCAHAGDLVPGMGASFDGDVYRDINYVASECESLARQLAVN